MSKINLVIVSGSHRQNSESSKVANYIEQEIQKNPELTTLFNTSIINLAHENIPFYDDNLLEKDTNFKTVWKPLSAKLNAANAFVIISPEWNGMVPSKLKNLFLLANKEFYHKPALLVTVSASFGGAYPIAELRTSSYKNSKICYIPDHVIIRHVQNFNQNPSAEEFTEIRERLANNLHTLFLYAVALNGLGQKVLHKALTEKYPFGM